MSVDEFFDKSDDSTSPVPQQVTTKKRKRTAAADISTDDLKKRARLHCKCPEQWRSVSRYSQKRLEEFVNEQDFMQQQQLYESIFGFAHKLLGLVMDTVSQGNGHVSQEIEADLSLRRAIEQEGSAFVSFLSNRFRIVALTAVDTFHGKQKEIASRPQIEVLQDHETPDQGSPSTDVAPEADWIPTASTSEETPGKSETGGEVQLQRANH